jgi:hypothetical protein
MASESSGLESLAQAARLKKLRTARGLLLFIGILTVVVNAVMFGIIEKQIDEQIEKEIAKVRQQGMIVDQAKVEEVRSTAIRVARVVQGAAIALGVVFVFLGIMVYRYPVPVTVTALILYIGATAVFGLLDPATLATGLIVKIIIVIALIHSLRTAVAYQQEAQAARESTDVFGQESM